jgi:hypothetical protein
MRVDIKGDVGSWSSGAWPHREERHGESDFSFDRGRSEGDGESNMVIAFRPCAPNTLRCI